MPSDDLIPAGRPYGARQQLESQMEVAGLPTSSEGVQTGREPLSPADGGRPPAVPAARPAAPTSDDPLEVLNPAASLFAPPTERDVFAAVAERATNPFMRLIAVRLQQEADR